MRAERQLCALLFGLGLIGCAPEPISDGFVQAETGQAVVPGVAMRFPEDHGPHPEFGLEWWYVTANLKDDQGQWHGVQWTLFRFRGPEGSENAWWQGQGYLAHLMHEQGNQHRAWERSGRGTQAKIQAQPFIAGLDHWWMRSVTSDYQPLHLVASEEDFALALEMAGSPLVRHGQAGFSDKSGDGKLASYYYSLPRLQVQGHLKTQGQWRAVEGEAWLDREWSSALLDDRFGGWDWMGLQLDDGRNLMLFCLLPRSSGERHCDGSLIAETGEVITLVNERIQWDALAHVDLEGARYPVKWQITLPSHDISLQVATRSRDQLNRLGVQYWEGPVEVSGSVSGRGFVEMTARGSQGH
ncbi:lipocalin-like domain-containing protein [Ferrimonas balearica]|uniref:lipocalin-like domain-containing protein n=1 Tax=Ferrimonas balearica TaxID=44012 RepID=UPI001C998DFD|nr:lipocalin-like domain-containing protein [Ferrimonas balearica]MBY5991623.1 ABC transporter [Ferrimonas balearica]